MRIREVLHADNEYYSCILSTTQADNEYHSSILNTATVGHWKIKKIGQILQSDRGLLRISRSREYVILTGVDLRTAVLFQSISANPPALHIISTQAKYTAVSAKTRMPDALKLSSEIRFKSASNNPAVLGRPRERNSQHAITVTQLSRNLVSKEWSEARRKFGWLDLHDIMTLVRVVLYLTLSYLSHWGCFRRFLANTEWKSEITKRGVDSAVGCSRISFNTSIEQPPNSSWQ